MYADHPRRSARLNPFKRSSKEEVTIKASVPGSPKFPATAAEKHALERAAAEAAKESAELAVVAKAAYTPRRRAALAALKPHLRSHRKKLLTRALAPHRATRSRSIKNIKAYHKKKARQDLKVAVAALRAAHKHTAAATRNAAVNVVRQAYHKKAKAVRGDVKIDVRKESTRYRKAHNLRHHSRSPRALRILGL